MAKNEQARRAAERDRRAAAVLKREAEHMKQQQEFARFRAVHALESMAPRVRFQERKLQRLRDEQTALLVAGRQAGLTWDALAAASGVTRQAVQQRVGRLIPSE